jgi:hypothetical protein
LLAGKHPLRQGDFDILKGNREASNPVRLFSQHQFLIR